MAKAPVLLTVVLTTVWLFNLYQDHSNHEALFICRPCHPTFLSHHPDNNVLPVDFIPPSLMDSSYSQDDGADNLPPSSIVAAAMDYIVN